MSEKHVEILERARGAILSGAYIFICSAIIYTSLPSRIRQNIINQIRRDLYPFHTLGDWLYKHHKICSFAGHPGTKIQATRLAWIDAMIEYWKDKP